MDNGIRGFWVAIATPVDAAGSVDTGLFARHAAWLFEQGVDGIVPFGTTGEGTSFSASERLAAVEALLRAGIAPGRIALGAGCPAIPDSVALTRGALGLGVSQVLLLPPYFYRDAPAQGIMDAFAAIIDGVGDARLRATLYHIPQVSGVGVPAAVLAELRRRYGPVLAGLKDSSADFPQFQAFRAAAPDVAITVGNESDIGRALAEGGAGTICGMANIVPGLVAAMLAGADEAATAAMRQAVGLIDGPFCATLKSALAAMTGEPGWSRMRAPLRPAEAAVGTRIMAAVQAMQLGRAA